LAPPAAALCKTGFTEPHMSDSEEPKFFQTQVRQVRFLC